MNMDFDKPSLPTAPYPTLPYSAPAQVPQMVIVTQPGVGQVSQDVPYKCLYLVCVIIDLIETIGLTLFILVAFFMVGLLQSAWKMIGSVPAEAVKFGFENNHQFTGGYTATTPDYGGGVLWTIRILLIVVLAVLIKIQMYGWQGYSNHDVCSIYGFVTFKVLSSLNGIVLLFLTRFSIGVVVYLAVKGSSVIIPILFAQQVSKLGIV